MSSSLDAADCTIDSSSSEGPSSCLEPPPHMVVVRRGVFMMRRYDGFRTGSGAHCFLMHHFIKPRGDGVGGWVIAGGWYRSSLSPLFIAVCRASCRGYVSMCLRHSFVSVVGAAAVSTPKHLFISVFRLCFLQIEVDRSSACSVNWACVLATRVYVCLSTCWS